MMNKRDKKPSLWVSLLPIAVLAAMLAVVGVYTGGDILNGGCQLSMFTAAAVTASLAIGVYGIPWKVMEQRVVKSIESSTISILVLLLIGAISGTWIFMFICPNRTDPSPSMVWGTMITSSLV